jgi:hypothetical protein
MSTLLLSPVLIIPSLPRVAAGGSLALATVGGSGSGYGYVVSQNRSGGATIQGNLYTAGPVAHVVDEVTCTDGQGNIGTREITVADSTFSLGSVRDECKERTDLVNSQFITTAEWNRMINKSAFTLYELVVSAYGNDYNVAAPYLFETDGVTQRYQLPPDFFKLLGVDVQLSDTTTGWLAVRKFSFSERNKFMTPYQTFYGTRSNLRYRLLGDKLWILPTASAGQFMQIHYVPRMTPLVSDTDVLNGLDGWEAFVTADVCAKACVKRETDPGPFLAEMQILAQRIQVIAEARDLGSPSTVVDVRDEGEE